jgi:hypothetical protein
MWQHAKVALLFVCPLLLLLLQVVSPFTADGLLGDWEITQRLWEYALRWDTWVQQQQQPAAGVPACSLQRKRHQTFKQVIGRSCSGCGSMHSGGTLGCSSSSSSLQQECQHAACGDSVTRHLNR